jgi:farnesyl-diphosphate farnesyltransferase
MARQIKSIHPGHSDEAYQDQILPAVSRTFALTIPQLPPDLSRSVTNAYLLCRVADTIEDEPQISPPDTLLYMERFSDAVAGVADAQLLGTDLADKLSQWTIPAERELIVNLARVIRVTRQLPLRQQAAIRRCVDTMCHGMHQFQRTASVRGLDTVADLDSYCYYVAGVVGEMLTELFCSHSPDIERQRAELSRLAPSFAQGLQMTNILKDVWEDRSRGACWLPQEVFTRHGVDLSHLAPGGAPARGFAAGMSELVGLAHAHLRNALEFTLLIPAREIGIRRFCLWAIGLAVLTLKRIAANPGFTQGSQVKVSRRTVAVTLALSNAATRRNSLLRFLFERAASGLPRALLPADWEPRKLQLIDAESEHAASAYHRARHVNPRDEQEELGLLRRPDRGTVQ